MNLSAAYLKKKEEWREAVQQELNISAAIGFLREGVSPTPVKVSFCTTLS
jgi:hypothetical protein